MPTKKLVVIGGGAAGFFCAVNAARLNPQLQVTLIEKTGKLLSKVKVSGGGRCNVTHSCFDIAGMSRKYPRGGNFVKKAFHRFFTTDTISWFEERGVILKTEADGRMFPVTDSSQTIIDCLLNEAAQYGVEIVMNTEVKTVSKNDGLFQVTLADSRLLAPDYVCIACGGYPKSSMFEWLEATGHSIEEPVPSLFTFNMPGHPIRELMGISVNAISIKIAGTKLEEKGPLLITHWGLSGPAVLKLSAWGAKELVNMQYNFTVRINWMAGNDYYEQNLKEQWRYFRDLYASKKLINQNISQLPGRLWEFLLAQSGIAKEMRFADLSSKAENLLIKNLTDYTVEIKGKTTFKEEFVTAGGIKLAEIDPHSMMSRKTSNLFFAGEVTDVDGITGGFNFQYAWTSGWICANSINLL
ncbi:MAG TPA: NAD(P)/FAD-dependent oxidoreductase [Chitinophagaceae bacterium]|jgi:predicted Rossmann fold flavoprotein|nr:NAD(P)/FAD-dependent oxidoreductase [Chitinophagaceae bacterium]